jgi:His-Xaa-Ser system protein HxsD
MVERSVTFDLGCYSVDAVQRALYRFSDRLSSNVAVDGGIVRCTLFIDSVDSGEVQGVVADFRNEVLDETLRARVREETAEVRNLILALAFSNSGLVDAEDA